MSRNPFNELSSDPQHSLSRIMSVRLFPKGTTLFRWGSKATCFYVVERGTVNVLRPTARGRNQLLEVVGSGANQLLEVVGSGAVLGLSESISGERYRITAEAGDETTAAYIPQEEFLKFLRAHHDFCLQVLRFLSNDLHGLYNRYRSISAPLGRPRHWPLDVPLSNQRNLTCDPNLIVSQALPHGSL